MFTQGSDALLTAAEEIMKKESFDYIITTSSPFSLLKLGYLLKNRFPKSKWIADFRDDWSTNKLLSTKNYLLRQIQFLLKAHFEKKWIKKAEAIISVSDVYADRLEDFHNKKTYVVPNGHSSLKQNSSFKKDSKLIRLGYCGNVYEIQNFEANLKAIDHSAGQHKDVSVEVNFIGTNFKASRKEEILKSYKNIKINFYPRMMREELDRFNESLSGFILCAYGNLKGLPSSKLYYMISFGKPVFLYPSDSDIMEETLQKSGLLIHSFLDIIKINKGTKSLHVEETMLAQFSRKNTVNTLIKTLEKIG